jgi:hypothetical protein
MMSDIGRTARGAGADYRGAGRHWQRRRLERGSDAARFDAAGFDAAGFNAA